MNQAAKSNHTLTLAAKHWKYVAPVLTYPRTNHEYKKLVTCLDMLLDIVGNNERHPLISLVDIISNLILSYEEIHLKKPKTKGIDALKFLIKAHGLRQSDLPEIGSQGVVSEILNGKRSLNLRQIKLLAQHFHVEPSTFIDK